MNLNKKDNMRSIKILIFFTLLYNFSIGQDRIYTLDVSPNSSVLNSFSISNTSSEEIGVLLETRNNFEFYYYDSNLKEKFKIEFTPNNNSLKNYIGYSIESGMVHIIFANNSLSKFAKVTCDLKDGKIKSDKLDFQLKEEKLIEFFNYKDKLHIITSKPFNKHFYIYDFQNLKFNKHEISINSTDGQNDYLQPANNLLKDNSFSAIGENLTCFSENNIYSFDQTALKAKVYTLSESIVITFDKENHLTRVISIDPESFLSESKVYFHDETRNTIKNSNSYIYDNKLFQISSANDFLKLNIYDLKTSTLIKSYLANDISEIYFKNGIIKQSKTDLLGGNKELEKSKQFLRKISKGIQGVSILKHKANYKVSIGSVKNVTFSGGNGFSFDPINQNFISSFPFKSDPDLKMVWIDCIFNENFDHISGSIEEYFPKTLLNAEKNNFVDKRSLFIYRDKEYRGVYIPSLKKYRISRLN